MSQMQTGSCPICGAPIYAQSPWWSILPPPPIYTCSCTADRRRTITTTNTCLVTEKQVNAVKLGK
jgi:hypothetical protein